MATKNDKYTYRVTWSEDDTEYVGLCAQFPPELLGKAVTHVKYHRVEFFCGELSGNHIIIF
jgi:hypothetical protein